MVWRAVDLFSGCGGLTTGLKQAGFEIVSAVECDTLAAKTYRTNHPEVKLLEQDIREVGGSDLRAPYGRKIHLVAGCPPCQGFSRVRRRNRSRMVSDDRNWLIDDFTRLIGEILPTAVFMENVPGIENYVRFREFTAALRKLGYCVTWKTLQLGEYGVPQKRRRVVVLAGHGFDIEMPKEAKITRTVRWAIGDLKRPRDHHSPLHREVAKHGSIVKERISAIPKNGGSRADWPRSLELDCHSKFHGFRDVYGRMAWDKQAPTITGGCINASKGRFLHPRQDRTITLHEAALLQSFPRRYTFSLENGRYPAARMIGNALPPEFARRVGVVISRALAENCDD